MDGQDSFPSPEVEGEGKEQRCWGGGQGDLSTGQMPGWDHDSDHLDVWESWGTNQLLPSTRSKYFVLKS